MVAKKGGKRARKKAAAKKQAAAETVVEAAPAPDQAAAQPATPEAQAGAQAQAEPQADTQADIPEFDNIGVLGHVGWLMARDEELKGYFINDMEWRVMPPVAFGQFKLWHAKAPDGANRPVAYASWAMVGDRQKARIEAGNKRLSPAEWKSGDHKVMIDVIAPFGGKDEILKELGV